MRNLLLSILAVAAASCASGTAGHGGRANAPAFASGTRRAATPPATSATADVPAMQPRRSKTEAFEKLAGRALVAMRARAEELRINGVAVVAYFEGESIQTWSSRMAVVGRLKNAPSQGDPGANLLAIAYSKAAEMADTLRDSGSRTRPPMTGESGWQGGLIVRGRAGYLIAAFSGGSSEDDVRVSRAGLDVLARGL